MNNFPQIDFLSFVLGIIFASLLFFVINRIYKLTPKIKEANKKNKELRLINRNSQVDLELRNAILRKCQSMHLGSSLFPLNSIYINIPLILPESHDPLIDNSELDLLNEIMPFLPENDLLHRGLPYNTISLVDALSANRRIVVLGSLGSGKTTSLNKLASDILENQVSDSLFSQFLPIYIHISEINNAVEESGDILSSLLDSSTFSTLQSSYESIFQKIKDYARTNRLLLLLDGMDELDEDKYSRAVSWINKYLNSYPNNSIVIVSGPNFSDGLEKIGFSAYFIDTPTSEQSLELFDKWQSSIRQIPVFQRLQLHLDSSISTRWFSQESINTNIHILSLQLLNYSLSDKISGNWNDLVSRHLERLINNKLPSDNLKNIAYEISQNSERSINKERLTMLLVEIQNLLINPETNKDESNSTNITLNDLIRNGLFIERNKGNYQFASPIFQAYLESLFPVKEISDWKTCHFYSFLNTKLIFSSETQYLNKWYSSQDSNLYRNISQCANHLSKLNDKHPLKAQILKQSMQYIQDSSLPISLRLRIFSVFLFSDDSLYQQILDFLCRQSRTDLKQIAAFGLGFDNSHFGMEKLRSFSVDPSKEVQLTSLISLNRIWNLQAQKILLDLYMVEKENVQRFIAQLISFHKKDGHDILKELTTIENISGRKAAISGLIRINQPWVKDLLVKISTDDSQWIVRDAAIHALEEMDISKLKTKAPDISPSSCKWLLQYASQKGIGIPANEYPYKLLLDVLNDGTINERKSSIDFLVQKPNKQAFQALISQTRIESQVREYALDALFRISRKGIDFNDSSILN